MAAAHEQCLQGTLRSVSPEERDVLEAASVAGVAFDAPAVAAGVGGATDAVEAICHRFSRSQRWLEHLGSREWPDGVLAARYAFRHALYQRTIYDGLSPNRRATLHEQIGERLEAGYAGRTAEVSSELATHFRGGRDRRRALAYFEQAATRAYDRRAYGDVIACLEPALHLLGEMPNGPERARDELRLRRLYAVVLSQTAGYASETLFENLLATTRLCEEVADFRALFDVFGELCLFYANTGDLVRAEEVAREQSRLVERRDEFRRAAERIHARCARPVGRQAGRGAVAARKRPVVARDAGGRGSPYGVNPVVAARSCEALRRLVVGDAGGARMVQEEALALAERHGRPITIAHATTFGALVLMLDEDWTGAVSLATRAVDLSEEGGFPRWLGTALVIRGRALVERRDEHSALAEIRGGLDTLKLTGQRLGDSLLLSAFAAACLRANHLDEGLAAVDAGLTHCRDTAERVFEAELWRLRGECLQRRGLTRARAHAPGPEAGACFEQARALARAQGARMLEERIRRGLTAGLRGTSC